MKNHIIIPKPLPKNGKIGLICPGGGLDNSDDMTGREKLNKIILYLENKGFSVKPGKYLFPSIIPYLSGTDDERMDDIKSMFLDPSVDAIFALKGGYGCHRLASRLKTFSTTMKKNPKLLCGFSDVTALLAMNYKYSGLVGIHSPMLGAKFFKENKKDFWNVIMKNYFSCKFSRKNIIKKGRAQEKIFPFNLSILCSMIGCNTLPDLNGGILLLEDIGEKPYEIDRLFLQLKNVGILDNIGGLILGDFTFPEKIKSKSFIKNLVLSFLSKKNIPIIENFPVGHSRHNVSIPFGIPTVLDTEKCSLSTI